MTCSFPFITLPSPVRSPATVDSEEAPLHRFFRTIYAPNLLRTSVRYFVIALFGGLFVLSWIGARHIDLGLGKVSCFSLPRDEKRIAADSALLALDQRLALPSSSYLVNYFNSLDLYLEIGPPVYFVIRHEPDLNITQTINVEKVCGRFSACEEYSVANVLEAERKRTDSPFLAEPPYVLTIGSSGLPLLLTSVVNSAVWIDDFVQWFVIFRFFVSHSVALTHLTPAG